MTTYYLLICAADTVNEDTRFFKIAAGSSAIDATRIHALRMLASSQGWYFAKYTHDTADFLLKISLSLRKMPDDLNFRHLRVGQFLSAWKSFSQSQCSGNKPDRKTTESRKQARRKAFNVPDNVIQHAESVRRTKPKSLHLDFMVYLNSIFSL